jgi:hypothetical protein
MSNKNNLLIEQFRAAGRLVNEWRDTLYYAANVAFATKLAMMGRMEPAFFCMVGLGVVREIIRKTAWEKSRRPEVLVGVNQSLPDPKKLSNDAGIVSNALLTAYFLGLEIAGVRHTAIPVCIGFAVALTYMRYRQSQGLQSVAKSYRDIMWDYPRKRSGGGTSQTQKLKDGFNNLAKQIGKLLPRPATGAALVPLQTRRNTAQLNS